MNESIFSSSEWLRYTRHIQLPQIGVLGQTRLKQSKVLVVGAGGLGCPVLLYLAAAGVGHITIVDGDTIDLTNLQRQILFTTDEIGQSKAVCASKHLKALNPDIEIVTIDEHLSKNNVKKLINEADIVVDCTDNFATRYLINDYCALLNKPWLFASIYQFSGQCALFFPRKSGESACFRCLFPEKPGADIADCNTAGVLGVLPGLLGTIQANEIIKYLSGMDSALENTLLMVEASDLLFKKIKLAKNTDCVICSPENLSETSFSKLEDDYKIDNVISCATGANKIDDSVISPERFQLLQSDPSFFTIDVRSLQERNSFNVGGMHIPLDLLEASLGELDSSKTVICYCQSGIRSAQAVELLRKNQFSACHLENGLVSLLKATNNL